MTQSPAKPAKDPLVCAVGYDGLCTFEFGIAVELFGLPRPEFAQWYRFQVVQAEPGPMRAIGGITLQADADLSTLAQASLIIVPGWRGVDVPVPDALCQALKAAHERGARIASICSGVFVLAAAGLLDGKSATTHWRYTDQLAQRYPTINVNPDVLFIEDNNVFSSAGSAAGLDLGLHIIRADYGAKAAATVARRLVLPAQRDGGQQQFVPRPAPKARAGSSIAALQDQIRSTLDQDWPIARMAQEAATSPRTLARRFAQETGLTPLNWLTAERVTRAAELLETGAVPMADVWTTSGFGSPETFRKEFRRKLGVPPTKYKERLGAGLQAGVDSGRGHDRIISKVGDGVPFEATGFSTA